jgi:hypothetical protein
MVSPKPSYPYMLELSAGLTLFAGSFYFIFWD